MSIKKQFLKSRPACKVTFRVSKEAARGADAIYLVGDFNGWKKDSLPMKALKSGEFTCQLELSTEQPEYQFRYYYSDGSWDNDWDVGAYKSNPLGTENTLLKLTQTGA